MRLVIAACFMSCVAPAAALDLPTQVSVTSGEAAQVFAGSATDGQTAKFEIKVLESGSLRFRVAAGNENCRVEMRTSSQLGYLPDFDRFPTQRTLPGKVGEIFALSFRQSRLAWMNKTQCSFSFSVGRD